jgi:hypothetical protein
VDPHHLINDSDRSTSPLRDSLLALLSRELHARSQAASTLDTWLRAKTIDRWRS